MTKAEFYSTWVAEAAEEWVVLAREVACAEAGDLAAAQAEESRRRAAFYAAIDRLCAVVSSAT